MERRVAAVITDSENLAEYRARATMAHLLDTFGSPEGANEWLNEYCPALGVRPVEILGDEKGRAAVNQVLVCIDHGMIY